MQGNYTSYPVSSGWCGSLPEDSRRNITDRWIKAVMAAGYNSGGHKDQVEGERELSWQWRHRRMAGSLREATKKNYVYISAHFLLTPVYPASIEPDTSVIKSCHFVNGSWTDIQVWKRKLHAGGVQRLFPMYAVQCVCVLGLLFLAPQ